MSHLVIFAGLTGNGSPRLSTAEAEPLANDAAEARAGGRAITAKLYARLTPGVEGTTEERAGWFREQLADPIGTHRAWHYSLDPSSGHVCPTLNEAGGSAEAWRWLASREAGVSRFSTSSHDGAVRAVALAEAEAMVLWPIYRAGVLAFETFDAARRADVLAGRITRA